MPQCVGEGPLRPRPNGGSKGGAVAFSLPFRARRLATSGRTQLWFMRQQDFYRRPGGPLYRVRFASLAMQNGRRPGVIGNFFGEGFNAARSSWAFPVLGARRVGFGAAILELLEGFERRD